LPRALALYFCLTAVLLDAGTGYVTVHALRRAGLTCFPPADANKSTVAAQIGAQTAMMMIRRFMFSK
jgi:hypothetical protein